MASFLHTSRLLLLLGFVLLGACGEAGDTAIEGVRVRILTSDVDGPVQGKLLLRATGAREEERIHELRRANEDEPDLYVAPGAEPGSYGVASTEGWGMLWGGLGSPAPYLRGADYPATLVRMGRPRTVYVAPADPNRWQASLDWAADARPHDASGDAPYEQIPLDIHRDAEGVVSLRFPEAFWRGGLLVRVMGRFEGGRLTQLRTFELRKGRFSRLPKMLLLDAAGHDAFRVRVVSTSRSAPVRDGTPVRIDALGLPLQAGFEARTRAGLALFDSVVEQGYDLRVHLPSSGFDVPIRMDSATRRLRGELTVALLTDGDARSVPLPAQAVGAREVRVRFEGGRHYGRVPLVASGAEPATHAYTVPGLQDWLVLRRDGTWLTGRGLRPTETPPALDGPVSGCKVRGFVRSAGGGYSVEFLRILTVEGAAKPVHVGGDGFTAAVAAGGRYEARLPPGRYAIRVLRPSGGGGRPVVQELKPGTQLRMDLGAR